MNSLQVQMHRTANALPNIPGVKNILLIASGKGGVGKSTSTTNLAFALQNLGAQVGILDADIYGPNQCHLLKHAEKPALSPENRFSPVHIHGLQTMSMGYLVDKQASMVWRGPMISGAVMQLLENTDWQNIDYLLIDLPPGTGDIQLTLCQKAPVTAAIMITTPETLATLDVRKAITMFQKMQVPVLGLIENMTTYVCMHCGKDNPLLGEGGGAALLAEYQLRDLGKIPFLRSIQLQAECGEPLGLALEAKAIYAKIAENIHTALADLPCVKKKPFPIPVRRD